MGVKYHVSPTTGRPNLCRADVRDCPVGGDHYSTKDEARAAYESSMEGSVLAPVVSKKTPSNDTQVESTTAWSYSQIVTGPRALGKLQKAYPNLTFSSSSEDEMVVRGPFADVKAYIEEPGGRAKEIKASLAAVIEVHDERKAGPSFTEDGEALPDENLFDDWEAAGGWDDELFPLEEPVLKEGIDEDDDYDSIKCDDCGSSLSLCTCGDCDFCGGPEGDHYEDCDMAPKRGYRYSWE